MRSGIHLEPLGSPPASQVLAWGGKWWSASLSSAWCPELGEDLRLATFATLDGSTAGDMPPRAVYHLALRLGLSAHETILPVQVVARPGEVDFVGAVLILPDSILDIEDGWMVTLDAEGGESVVHVIGAGRG